MSKVTPPTPLRAAHIAPGAPLHGTLKGALATLVLMLLALLFWQLLDQLQQNQKNQQQYTIDYSADLAEQISLNMALSAKIALNLLPMVEPPRDSEQQQGLMRTLQRSLPELRSVALLAPSGAMISDSAADSQRSSAAWSNNRWMVRWAPDVHRLFSRQSLHADVLYRIARLRVCLPDGLNVLPAGHRIVSVPSSYTNCAGRKKSVLMAPRLIGAATSIWSRSHCATAWALE